MLIFGMFHTLTALVQCFKYPAHPYVLRPDGQNTLGYGSKLIRHACRAVKVKHAVEALWEARPRGEYLFVVFLCSREIFFIPRIAPESIIGVPHLYEMNNISLVNPLFHIL